MSLLQGIKGVGIMTQQESNHSLPARSIVGGSVSECVCANIPTQTIGIVPDTELILKEGKLYFNSEQKQTYTAQQLRKLLQSWETKLSNGNIQYETFTRLHDSHFKNLKELEKRETIEGRNHSVQCSYATDANCHCWCGGKYHGRFEE